MKYFSMFSGIGGFEIPLSKKGYECIGFSEVDKYAISIYKRHFKGHKNYGDATAIITKELPDFDLLVGGFPCQAFSIAGKRAGFLDTRGTLFFEIARVAKAKEPMFMLLENVKGLMSIDGGESLEVILESLQEIGYYINIEVYNTKDYGLPQNRERIFFKCTHIKGLISDGQKKKISTSRTIIEQWLFQLLSNNLEEVKKLQDHASKDWVVGYLVLKEIITNILQTEKSKLSKTTLASLSEKLGSCYQANLFQQFTGKQEGLEEKSKIELDGILTSMEEKLFRLDTGSIWQSIDLLCKSIWEENYLGKNTYTISTVTKQITGWKTYTYAKMLMSICVFTAHLRSTYKNSWKEVLSNLTVIQESTKYARINDKSKEVVITESGTMHRFENEQGLFSKFIAGCSSGEGKFKVFPIGENDTVGDKTFREKEQEVQTYRCLEGTEYKGISSERFDGICQDMRIRRLTPIECERLQGFPDNWTQYGENGEKISDTQRYKCLGNAVSTNVIERIFRNWP